MDDCGLTTICNRMRQIRLRVFGSRGKARFARELGVRATTYQGYERDRIPPVEVVLRAVEVTGCDLVWLLTGRLPAGGVLGTGPARLVERVADLLRRHPDAGTSLEAFLRLIDPAEVRGTGETVGLQMVPASFQRESSRPSVERASAPLPFAAPITSQTPRLAVGSRWLVPVVGGTAAGSARFWRDFDFGEEGADPGHEASVRLDKILKEPAAQSHVAECILRPDGGLAEQSDTVALIQMSEPDERGIVEFLSCPGLSGEGIGMIAWRIDGDSMEPRYRDGDFVLVRTDQEAVDGLPCVAHQQGQIGVNCKIFKREQREIVLIPLNESYPTQRFPASELLWAHRVLYSVRLATRETI